MPFDRNNFKNLYLFLQEDSIKNIPITNGPTTPLDYYYRLRLHSNIFCLLGSKSPPASNVTNKNVTYWNLLCNSQKSIIKAPFDFDQMHRRMSTLSLSFIFGLFNFLLFGYRSDITKKHDFWTLLILESCAFVSKLTKKCFIMHQNASFLVRYPNAFKRKIAQN